MNTRHYKIILAIILFLMIFCLLGLPFTEWGFRTDAWANVYHFIIKQWSDFGIFFTENLEDMVLPSNGVPAPRAFFSILYRPLLGLFYHPQYCLFGTNGYGYYLVMIALHAFLSVVLFFLFSNITTLGWSFFCAALFGFHPSLWDWMGWISAQSYVIEGILFVGVLLSLHRYFSTQRFRWYVLSCLLFTGNLFLKEMLTFFPFWLVMALYFYHTFSIPRDKKPSFLPSLPVYIRQASGFFMAMFFYVFVRASIFPITRETKTLTFEPTIASFVSRMASRLFDFVTYTVDLMGLSWLPEGTMPLKIMAMTLLVALFCYFFYFSTRKSLIVFILFSIPLFSWPSLVMHHAGRYLYVAIMLVVALIAFLSSSYKGPVIPSRRIHAFVLGSIITINIIFLMRQQRSHEQEFAVSTKALVALAKNLPAPNRPLCFFALPSRLFGYSAAPAIWLLRRDFTQQQPIYHYDSPDTIPPKILDLNPVFITWDYEKKDFCFVGKP